MSAAWQPTVAFGRAATVAGVLIAIALVWRRPDVLVIATAFVVITAWSAVTRPRAAPTIDERLGRSTLREGEASRWRAIARHLEASPSRSVERPSRSSMVGAARGRVTADHAVITTNAVAMTSTSGRRQTSAIAMSTPATVAARPNATVGCQAALTPDRVSVAPTRALRVPARWRRHWRRRSNRSPWSSTAPV